MAESINSQTQEQPIIIDSNKPTDEQPAIQFSTEPRTYQFSTGSRSALLSPGAIDFRPDRPSSQATTTSSAQSKADKARAKTAKAREARAKKVTERKASSSDTSNKSARITDLAETASQERIESELSSELDKVNMRDLERQLSNGIASSLAKHDLAKHDENDEDFQPSPERSRKRKQPHSEDLSLLWLLDRDDIGADNLCITQKLRHHHILRSVYVVLV